MFIKICAFLILIQGLALAAWKEGELMIKTTTGAVTKMTKKGTFKDVNPGMIIKVGESLITKKNSSAELMFKDGSLVILKEDSKIKIKEYSFQETNEDERKVHTYLARGGILFMVEKLIGEDSKFDIQTSRATASIRGTKGGVDYEEEKQVSYLEEGKMDVKDKKTNVVQSFGANEIVYSAGKDWIKKSYSNGDDFFKGLRQIKSDLGMKELFFKGMEFTNFETGLLKTKVDDAQKNLKENLNKNLDKKADVKKLKSLF